jgi:ribosomal protein S18 acetylase RimI-like enzyme
MSVRDLEIGDVNARDLPAIIEIDAGITGARKPELWRELVAETATDANRSFLVARTNGQIVGYVVGEIRRWEFGSPPCGWLFTIGVRPDYRLARTGTELFEALVSRFRDKGVATCRTMLHIDDHLLMSFFRAQGLTAGPFIELEKRLADELDA